MSMFSKPASNAGITWADHLGQLVLIEPTGFEEQVQTAYDPTDAVRGTITFITDPVEVVEDILIFPRALVQQTRSKIGEKVLGRLGQKETKSGNKAWVLEEASEEDIAAATAYVNARVGITGPASAEAKAPWEK